MKTKRSARKQKKKQSVRKKQYNCTVCMETKAPKTKAKLPCGHEFCGDCIQKWAKCESSCPLCRKTFDSYRYKGRTVKVKQKKQGRIAPPTGEVLCFLEHIPFREAIREDLLDQIPGVNYLILYIYRCLLILEDNPLRFNQFASTDVHGARLVAEELADLAELHYPVQTRLLFAE